MTAASNHPPTLMIVDDQPTSIKLLEAMLEGQGCQVCAFLGGQPALAAAAKEPPDLILLDINMPEMDGYEVCRRLKADAKLKDIPVLFISARNEVVDKVKAFGVGGVDYVTKPFRFEEVHARVQTHLKLRCLQRELEQHNAHLDELVLQRTRQLVEAQKDRQEVLRRFVTAQEDERRRVAVELHDQMGQHLASLMLGLKKLEASGNPPGSSGAELASLRRLVNNLMKEVHHLAWELRPAMLDQMGLRVALRRYIEEWSQQAGIAADFDCVGSDEGRLQPMIEIILYRVVQETLTNVSKHASAREVYVSLELRPADVAVMVKDDGRGFDVDAVMNNADPKRRLGILGMQERVELAGGTFTLQSSHGKGTSVTVTIPLTS